MPDARGSPRRGIRSERRRHRPRRSATDRPSPARTCCSTSSCRRRAMGSSRRGSPRAAMCSAKSRWPRRSTTRAISSRAPRPRGGSTPWCRTAAISRACAASRARCARRDRRHHQRPRRFLPRPAFRRLSRGDGPCPAARHGDPQLRRLALHDRARRLGRLLPGMEPAVTPGIARALGGRDLRARERRGLHLSRQLVRARAANVMGMRVALRRRKGHAALGRRRLDPHRGCRVPASATACSTR